jgi:hypothetical protein
VGLSAASGLLTVSRQQAAGSSLLLGSFNMSQRENGLVLGAWNLLRVLLTSDAAGGARLLVFCNPMLQDTGFTGVPEVDASLVPLPLQPLLSVLDSEPLPAGGLALLAGGAPLRADYVSALPASVY